MDSRDSQEIVAIQETLALPVVLEVQDQMVLLDLLVRQVVRVDKEVVDCQVNKVLEALMVFKDLLEGLVLLVPLDCLDLLALEVSLVTLDSVVHQVSLVSQVRLEILVLPATQVLRDLGVMLDPKVNRVCLDLLELLVRVDHQVSRVQEELVEHREGLVQLVTLDHVDLMDQRVSLAS